MIKLKFIVALFALIAVSFGQDNEALEEMTSDHVQVEPLQIVANNTNLKIGGLNVQGVSIYQPWNLRFSLPVDIQSDGKTSYLYIVEQVGLIKVFDSSKTGATPPTVTTFLDITKLNDFSVVGSFKGLLGLAFDPQFSNNSYFYVFYTTPNIVISRFTAMNSTHADPKSEVVILSISHKWANNYGGQLAFGPDGYLHIGIGDGGAVGNPTFSAQDPMNPLGKIFRIDVSSIETGNTTNSNSGRRRQQQLPSQGQLQPNDMLLVRNYKIPSDNPFQNQTDLALPEILAWGFRNPAKFSFDTTTGHLWVADSGLGNWQEIDVLKESGKNYGWPLIEGPACFMPPMSCSLVGEEPIFAFNNTYYLFDQTFNHVVGGFVYRGSKLPTLNGSYIFAESKTATLLNMKFDSKDPMNNTVSILGHINDIEARIRTFGLDSNQEIFFADYVEGFLFGLQTMSLAPTGTTAAAPNTAGTEGYAGTYAGTFAGAAGGANTEGAGAGVTAGGAGVTAGEAGAGVTAGGAGAGVTAGGAGAGVTAGGAGIGATV